ncbi:hypothetical protein [Streptomyces sp. NEAU-174]|uniref:hypothetical protein n=1 Tax=Streptomyces sp. NEAU-174 TaxID=3458254 RepID=UPI004043F812
MNQPTTTTFAWCFSHGRLHHFDDEPWCTATWAVLPGTTEAEALAVKEEWYGDAEFLHQLPDEQQIALIDAHRSAPEAAASTINTGLDTLFRRLGPPPADTKEK